MKRYTATIEVTKRIKVEVEVGDSQEYWGQLLEKALTGLEGFSAHPVQGTIVQHGEPWLAFGDWYDLHGHSPILVCERATGNCFTREDIIQLSERISRLGLRITDCWNGTGCTSVSFHCQGRVGEDKMNPEQLAILHAPRKKS